MMKKRLIIFICVSIVFSVSSVFPFLTDIARHSHTCFIRNASKFIDFLTFVYRTFDFLQLLLVQQEEKKFFFSFLGKNPQCSTVQHRENSKCGKWESMREISNAEHVESVK
jgi:hypothetical protein